MTVMCRLVRSDTSVKFSSRIEIHVLSLLCMELFFHMREAVVNNVIDFHSLVILIKQWENISLNRTE